MTKPESITIGDINYYNASELEIFDPKYFVGCKKTIRQIIDKKNIIKENIAYGNNNKRYGWRLSKNQKNPPPKANLLLKEDWVLKNIPKMNIEEDTDDESEEHPKLESTMKKEKKTKSNEINDAPLLLELNDEEKFHDDDGNTFEIETRGERTADGIYFLAEDVSDIFEMESLVKNIKDRKSSYYEGNDFVYFTRHSGKKHLYMTYEGMIKLLYSSLSKKAKTFRNWATNVLFVNQMGTKEQKEYMAAGLIGIPADTIKEVLSKSAGKISCVYRFVFGTVKELRNSMKLSKDIPDDYIIIKYGFTDDLARRTSEHMKTYGSIKNSKLELMNFAYIDPQYISDAETDVKEFFEDIELFIEYKSHKELVAINPKHDRQIKKLYKNIKNEYGGCVKNLNDKIEELRREVNDRKLEIDNLAKLHDAQMKANNMENENNMLKKNLEIAELKYQLLLAKQ